eukprot:9068695-Alexandrium_andersonii.AAC.1
MSASLVGSEMCIRDRWELAPFRAFARTGRCPCGGQPYVQIRALPGREPVSYTHLTLPTICSV